MAEPAVRGSVRIPPFGARLSTPRQAYRYLEQAQQLKGPVPPGEAKLAFTVKLPHSLIQRVRAYATTKRLSISEVVSRALLALLPRAVRMAIGD